MNLREKLESYVTKKVNELTSEVTESSKVMNTIDSIVEDAVQTETDRVLSDMDVYSIAEDYIDESEIEDQITEYVEGEVENQISNYELSYDQEMTLNCIIDEKLCEEVDKFLESYEMKEIVERKINKELDKALNLDEE